MQINTMQMLMPNTSNSLQTLLFWLMAYYGCNFWSVITGYQLILSWWEAHSEYTELIFCECSKFNTSHAVVAVMEEHTQWSSGPSHLYIHKNMQ